MNRYIMSILVAFCLVALAGCAQTAPEAGQGPETAKKAPATKSSRSSTSVNTSAPAPASGMRMLSSDFSSSLRSGTTVVYFAKISCPSCKRQDRMWKKAITKLPAGVQAEKRFTYAVDHRAYGIRRLPTLVFYKDGIEVSRKVGVMSESDIIKAANRAQ